MIGRSNAVSGSDFMIGRSNAVSGADQHEMVTISAAEKLYSKGLTLYFADKNYDFTASLQVPKGSICALATTRVVFNGYPAAIGAEWYHSLVEAGTYVPSGVCFVATSDVFIYDD